MSFTVVVDQFIPLDRIEQALAVIESDFATSHARYPGRRSTRVFRHLSEPGHILAIGEWDSRADYERLRASPSYRQTSERADPPARIEYLTRLRLLERMAARLGVVACVRMTAPECSADALREHILDAARRDVERAVGLVFHEAYQVGETGTRFLAVHGWRSLADLERFRAEDGPRYDVILRELGVAVERFTGAIAAQYSRFDERSAPVSARNQAGLDSSPKADRAATGRSTAGS